MAGAVEMIVESADISNGHLQITTDQGDKVLSSFTSGHVFETTESEEKYPVMVLASTRKDEYTGKALQDQGFNFEYDPSPNGTKGISGAGIGFDQNGYYEVHQYTPAYSERLDAKYPVTNGSGYRANLGNQKADVITPFKNGFMIDCLISEKNKPTNIDGLETEGEKTIEYHVIIMKETDIEAFIVPAVSADEYHKWMPEGPDPKDEKTTGNGLSFTVFTKDKKKPDQKITANIKSVIYSLTNVSHEPGYSMNYPSDKPGTKADLQLLKTNEKPDPETEKLNLTLTASQGRDVNVACFDYGAYGYISATVILNDGTIVMAKEEKSKKPYATIPYRTDDNSQIADYWKEQNKATGLKDDDDSETGEDNVGDHNGDGLSLYEEYRGFIENKKHIRTDPLKKDVMVCNKIEKYKERSENGISLYQGVTHTIVHHNFLSDEFGRYEDVPSNANLFIKYQTKPINHDKVINFNSSPQTHIVDQHGILMLPTEKKLGAAFAVGIYKIIGTPKNYAFLVIPSDFDPSPNGYAVTRGDILDGNVKFNKDGKAKIITDFYASRVAHEMLHYSNIDHHGSGDYWYGDYKILPDRSSVVFSEINMDGTGVDKDHDGNVDKTKIKLMDDQGKEILPTDARWQEGGIWEKGFRLFFQPLLSLADRPQAAHPAHRHKYLYQGS